jgi:hypothetical protein
MAKTVMRVTIDFQGDFDITQDLKEIADFEGLTVEEVKEEALYDPAMFFDSILSDLDYETDIEFIERD